MAFSAALKKGMPNVKGKIKQDVFYTLLLDKDHKATDRMVLRACRWPRVVFQTVALAPQLALPTPFSGLNSQFQKIIPCIVRFRWLFTFLFFAGIQNKKRIPNDEVEKK